MKKIGKNIVNKKPSIYPVGKLIYIYIILIVIIVLMIFNTINLNNTLGSSTNTYVNDVTSQLADDISMRIEAIKSSLRLLSDSINILPDNQEISSFLQKKCKSLEFTDLFVIDDKGNTIPEQSETFDLSLVSSSFKGENNLIYLDDQSLLFSTPIYDEKGISKVLIGIRDKENIQNLIKPKSFNGQGLSCIIDQNGNVVISPTDLKPFMQLDNIFKDGTDTDAVNHIKKMRKNIINGKSGVFEFTASDDTSLIISYHYLDHNDWTLLTLVPGELISSGTNQYIFYNFILVACVICVFSVLLYLIFLSYKKHKNWLEKIAFTDPLTAGLNNAGFQLDAQKLVNTAPPSNYTVIFLDIKQFKLINQNYGFNKGNDVLKHIYNVIYNNISSNELVARSENDHFFICLNESNKQIIQTRLDMIIAEINSFAKNKASQLTILQGACLIENPNSEINIIQDYARLACRLNSKKSRCTYYDKEILDTMKKEQELNDLFENSIKNKDFHMFLQPKIIISNNKIGGAEALVRWFHPERGTIYPSDFIPLFERNDNIIKLDLYIFEEVCIFLQDMIARGEKPFVISVNVSRVHFKDNDFLKAFARIKEQYRIPNNLIELELTESIFFDNQQIESIKDTIHQIHQYGFLCSLDDFGAGFSSLGLLKDFKVDGIKMDKKFFDDISSQKSKDIIANFIELADKLNISLVAEGIETLEQLEFLKSVHCNMVQGYIYSKPLPVDEFILWLKTIK